MIKRNVVFENLIVLWIAVEKNCTQEVAFKYFDRAASGNKRNSIKLPHFDWTKCDIQDLLKFREEGLTYKEIASYYGLTSKSIINVIKRYEIAEQG